MSIKTATYIFSLCRHHVYVWSLACCLLFGVSTFSSAQPAIAVTEPTISATNGSLWRFVTADQTWPQPPAFSLGKAAVILDAKLLASLTTGSTFELELANSVGDSGRFPVTVLMASTYVNGDRALRAALTYEGESYPVVLTLGNQSVFVYIEAAGYVWQLDAIRDAGSPVFRGWIYEPGVLPADTLDNDFVIPQRENINLDAARIVPLPRQTKPQALQLEKPDTVGTAQEANSTGINNANLTIKQIFPGSVIAGNPLDIEIRFTNISNEAHQNLTANIYFVLENTNLTAAPGNCSPKTTAGGDRVLSCQLGNFAPAQERSVSFTVQTSIASKPFIESTVIIGGLRHDAYVNVVEDVVTDSDNDGVSNFNEILLGTDPMNAASVDTRNAIIDVMALYTEDADTLYGGQAETRINQLISVANQIYIDSGVRITLRPVYHGKVNYPDQDDMNTMLDNLTSGHAAFSQVPVLRQTYGADLVMLFRPRRAEVNRCGLANLGGYNTEAYFSAALERNYAFSLIAIDCPVSSVVAHELGHNMGLTHSRKEDGAGGTLPYATGYGVDSAFTTVMAFPQIFNTDVRIARFSSPALDCLGQPCGIDHHDLQQGADAVRSLNLVAQQIANYYPSTIPSLPELPVANISGTPTDARIASAATVNNGLSYSQNLAAGDSVSISADLYIDSRHIGLQGRFHVLIGLGNGEYIAYTEKGLATENWDGTFAGLLPFKTETATFRFLEYLQLLRSFKIDPAYVGRALQIYIAYSVLGTEELIFTQEPLQLKIIP